MPNGAREKGLGYFGELSRPGGGISTEISVGVEIGGREIEIPLLVPGLTESEINRLLEGGEPTKAVVGKAIRHATERLKVGKSPFAQVGEQTGNAFTGAIGETLKREGGLNVNEIGRGGVSNFGITQQTLNEYNKARELPAEDVSIMPESKAQQILLEDFYQGPGFNRLPRAIGDQLFDYGVQSGPGTAIKALQKVVGTKPDGILGPITQQAVGDFLKSSGENTLVNSILDERQTLINRLTRGSPQFREIKRGLDNRIRGLRP